MNVITQRDPKRDSPTCEIDFERLLPRIREQARIAFRFTRPEAREELVQEVIGSSFAAFTRLVERGKADLAYATPLAQYAIRQVRSGRRVGSPSNVRDVCSKYAQLAKGIIVERLDQFDAHGHEWREALVEDKHAGPAETAAARIDLAAWLRSLTCKKRQIARMLAQGEATGAVARRLGLSAGRIAQMRREFERSWDAFQSAPAGHSVSCPYQMQATESKQSSVADRA